MSTPIPMSNEQTIQGNFQGQLVNGTMIVHQGHGKEAAERLLTLPERKELNDKVKELCDKYQLQGFKVWLDLHRIIGTENIEQMRRSHREPAKAILDLLLEREREREGAKLANAQFDKALLQMRQKLAAAERVLDLSKKQNLRLEAEVRQLRDRKVWRVLTLGAACIAAFFGALMLYV